MVYKIFISITLALILTSAAYAMGMKCDHPSDKYVYAFTKWYGGCDKSGLRDGDGIELFEHKQSGNRTARRVIYYSGSVGSIKFEEYLWTAEGNYIGKSVPGEPGGLPRKASELPAWAKFIIGPKGRSPTPEEVEAVQKFRQSTPAWSK